jgi:hypothetical protein
MNGDEAGADQETKRHHHVWLADRIEISTQRPRCGIGIVRLNRCAAPGGISIAGAQDLAIGIDDRDHHDIVYESAKDGTPQLGQEHDARRDFEVFAHFEVGGEIDAISYDVVRPRGEVHVADGPFGHE